MRLLFLTHSFNSLAQRLFVDLEEAGHEVSVELDINDATTRAAVARFEPDLVIAPFLKRRIPRDVWSRVPCLIVHPGIPGDRGPSSLDWALLEEAGSWGVTILQANDELDAGDLWAWQDFAVRRTTKSDLYRREVADAASRALLDCLARHARQELVPQPQIRLEEPGRGRLRPAMKQLERAIDWERDPTETVLRKLRASDSSPGVRDRLFDRDWYLFGAHAEDALSGPPGAIVARRHGAICRATIDGAVWITHLQSADTPSLKLPAASWLAKELEDVPKSPVSLESRPGEGRTFRDIAYQERGPIGLLSFDFYNGAMSTEQCERLLAAYRYARSRPTRVIALLGGESFWSNGIHLHAIEAADSPADESWANIQAMNDLAREVIETDGHLTMAVMRGNAAAGGVFLALAADRVLAREGIVLNPHYKAMGNLYGSEYWTYLLPRRVGPEQAAEITELRLPIGVRRALALGLVDASFAGDAIEAVCRESAAFAAPEACAPFLAEKREKRRRDEAEKPLQAYRAEELARMQRNFYGFDPSYHVARFNFVFRVPHSRTPSHLARHRTDQRASRSSEG